MRSVIIAFYVLLPALKARVSDLLVGWTLVLFVARSHFDFSDRDDAQLSP